MDLLEYVKQRLKRPEPPTLRVWGRASVKRSPPAGLDPSGLRQWLESEIAAIGCTRNLDLCGSSLEGLDLGSQSKGEQPEWEGLVFGLAGDDRPIPAHLAGARFRGAVLRECRFANVDFDRVDLTECLLIDCDLRYAEFRNAKLGHATFERCDMFGASIQSGTIATECHFRWSTLPELVGGITGLEWWSFEKKDHVPALAGEDAQMYASLLLRTERDRPDKAKDVAEAIDQRLLGAAAGYRMLSGYLSTQGRFSEANLAYLRSRRLERRSAGPWHAYTRRRRQEGSFRRVRNEKGVVQAIWRQRKRSLLARFKRRWFRPLRWSWLWIADVISRFGQSLWAVIATLVVVTFLPGFAYAIWGGVKGASGLRDDLYYSASHLAAANPAHLEPAGRLVEWMGLVQSTLAITLVGLFGFVLGNVLRQS
jgi:Pentapeptide repeats (9 copies)